MSKLNLNTMLQFLCPDGIELKKLSDVARVERGKRVVKEQLSLEKGFPVFQNSLTPMGYHAHYNYEGKTTYVIGAGAAGEIGYSTELFWAADDCFPIVCNQEVCSRYIFHVLKWRQEFLKAKVRRASIPRLSRDIISDLTIPVPPLAVQEEIVRILDKFTELEAELEKELEARKKQYEWYRDRLLDSASNAEQVAVGSLVSSGLVEIVTPSIKIQRNMYQEAGVVPIVSQEIERISGYCNIADQRIPIANYVCFGDHSEHIKYIDFSFVQGADGLKIMKPNETKIIAKYFYYAIQGKYARRNNYERHFKYLQETKIPVPSIEEQERIVAILDRLDALCNDITTGLPAEIAARRKQYEYYRDKLLSFEEVA